MALYRNVRPLYFEHGDGPRRGAAGGRRPAARQRRVQHGDLIVLTIGEPMGKSGGTNTMKIVRVGEHRG